MCRYCSLDLRALWLIEVEAIASDAASCARAIAAAEAELLERMQAQDLDDPRDEKP